MIAQQYNGLSGACKFFLVAKTGNVPNEGLQFRFGRVGNADEKVKGVKKVKGVRYQNGYMGSFFGRLLQYTRDGNGHYARSMKGLGNGFVIGLQNSDR